MTRLIIGGDVSAHPYQARNVFSALRLQSSQYYNCMPITLQMVAYKYGDARCLTLSGVGSQHLDEHPPARGRRCGPDVDGCPAVVPFCLQEHRLFWSAAQSLRALLPAPQSIPSEGTSAMTSS